MKTDKIQDLGESMHLHIIVGIIINSLLKVQQNEWKIQEGKQFFCRTLHGPPSPIHMFAPEEESSLCEQTHFIFIKKIPSLRKCSRLLNPDWICTNRENALRDITGSIHKIGIQTEDYTSVASMLNLLTLNMVPWLAERICLELRIKGQVCTLPSNCLGEEKWSSLTKHIKVLKPVLPSALSTALWDEG